MATTMISNSRIDLKIVVVGSSGTGKTSFCNKWMKDIFNETYRPTIMSEFSWKIFEYKGKYYKIQLWDIGGQDKSIYTSKIFTKDAHGCLVLCDITNPRTIEETLKWKKSIDETSKFIDGDFLPSILIQNKIDLVNDDELANEDDIRGFCEQNNFKNIFRTSAKTGMGINESMDFLISAIIVRLEEHSKNTNTPLEKDRKSIVVQQQKKEKELMIKSNRCCF